VNPNVFCSYCDYCLSGRLILCSNDAGAKAERPALRGRAQVFLTCPACRTSPWAGILGPPPTGSRPTLRRHYHKKWTKKWGQVRSDNARPLALQIGDVETREADPAERTPGRAVEAM